MSEMMGNEQENLLKKYTTCSNTPEITASMSAPQNSPPTLVVFRALVGDRPRAAAAVLKSRSPKCGILSAFDLTKKAL
jgi:hypothetical protein